MKRLISFILAFVLVLGMLPMGAVSASAAVTKTSDNAIEFIKEWEGYRSTHYADGKNADGTQRYSIGYGTSCKADEYPNGISKAVAADLLKDHLNKVVEPAVANFATKYSLSLSQQQFDALVSISYNCGTAWLQETGTLRTAVISGLKGNSFLYAMGLWSTNGGVIDTNLVKRRLAEADMYLNGSYTKNARSSYTYVLLDTDGGATPAAEKIQAYDALDPTRITVSPTKTGYTFLGWYNAKNNGSEVKLLDMSTSGATLYAYWQAANAEETPVKQYTIKAYELANKTPYVKHQSGTAEVDGISLKDTDVLTVTAEYVDSGSIKWVKATIGGKTAWFELGNIQDYKVTNTQVTVTVTAETLNYRTSAGNTTDNAKGSLKKGDKVLIIATTTAKDGTKDATWGKIGTEGASKNHWICLDKAYTDYEDVLKAESNTNIGNSVVAKGKVIADVLNIRAAASVDSAALKTQLKKDDAVAILAIQNDGNKTWGKIKVDDGYGWIDLGYVDMSVPPVEEETTTPTTPATKTGYVSNTDKVNIRSAAGARNNLVKTLASGTKVTIYETTTTDNALWGRIGDGQWVAMMYITLEETTSSGTTGSTGNSSTTVLSTGFVNSTMNLKVRTGPGMTYAQINSLPTGTKVSIYEETTTAGAAWGRIGDGQWVCLNYVTIQSVGTGSTGGNSNNITSANGVMGTVVNCANAVNIRSAAGVGNALVGVAGLSTRLKIYETTEVNGVAWGRTDKGWVCMTYIKLDSALTDNNTGNTGSTGSTGSTDTQGVKTGKIVNVPAGMNVNIRAAAGVNNAVVTTLPNGTAIKIYEQVDVNNVTWAKIEQGWVYMYYVQIDAANTNNTGNNGTGTSSERTVGIVNSNIDLKVRSGPGVDYAQVNALKKGTQIIVLEQQLTNGMLWGRIGDNQWVSLNYVTLTGSAGTGTGVMGTITNCGAAVNVRTAPGVNNVLVGTIMVNSRVEIYEQTLYGGQYWGRVNQGWICMQYVTLDSAQPPITDGKGTVPTTEATTATTPSDTTTATTPSDSTTSTEATQGATNSNPEIAFLANVKITANTLSVYKEANAESDKIGDIKKNEAYPIYALKAEGNQIWAKIGIIGATGWANFGSMSLDPSYGAVTSDTLDLYKEAATSSEKLAELKKGNKITISEIRLEGGKALGKTTVQGTNRQNVTGWVNLTYVKMGSEGYEIVNPPAPTLVTVTAKKDARMHAETSAFSQVYHTFDRNTEVNITEVKKVDNGYWGVEYWGKVYYQDKTGWVSLNNMELTAEDYAVINPPAATIFNATAGGMGVMMYSEADASKATSTAFFPNTSLKITEIKFANGTFWGKVYYQMETGWVQLDKTSFSVDGTIVASDPNVVPVYDNSFNVTDLELANGTAVKISAVQYRNNESWAKVTVESSTGWVKMVNLTSVFG